MKHSLATLAKRNELRKHWRDVIDPDSFPHAIERRAEIVSIKVMTFHHQDPSEKEFAVSQMLDRSWEVLRAELDKCELLCFNCHMEEPCGIDQAARHAGRAEEARVHGTPRDWRP